MDVYTKLELYDRKVYLSDVTHGLLTGHARRDRAKRIHKCLQLNRFDDGQMGGIDRVFYGACEDGKQKLYAVTKRGIMFVLDKVKFELGYPSVITVFPVGMSQVFYYYRQCGLDVPHQVITAIRRWDDSVAGKMRVEGIDT